MYIHELSASASGFSALLLSVVINGDRNVRTCMCETGKNYIAILNVVSGDDTVDMTLA